jgi:hypothetical protein
VRLQGSTSTCYLAFRTPLSTVYGFFFSSFVLRLYERGWPSYYIINARGKSVGVRGIQICVRKLTLNSSVCALFRVRSSSIATRDEGFKVFTYIKYLCTSILRVRKAALLNFKSARSLLSIFSCAQLGRYSGLAH